MSSILIPLVIVGGSGLFFGLMLAFASKKFQIHGDPRVDKIYETLPKINCGSCGFPNCTLFAKAVLEGKAELIGCIPGGSTVTMNLADVMGIDLQQFERKMAVVHCKGGKNEARQRAIYDGVADCDAAIMTGNGTKICLEACIGLGTCVKTCPYGAIVINENQVAEIIADKCKGCGRCIKACPRDLIELIPRVHKIFLACNNHDRGAKVKKYCSVGCTSCALCVKATPLGAITMEKNLAHLDYSKDDNFVTAANSCPQRCFVDLIKVRPKANIDMKCIGCGDCVKVCPVKGAIIGEPEQRHVINKQICIGCGNCLDSCKVHAITLWGGLGYIVQDKSKRQRK